MGAVNGAVLLPLILLAAIIVGELIASSPTWGEVED